MDPDDMMKTPTKKKGEYPGPVWREDDPIARDIERGPLAEHTIAKVPDVFGLSLHVGVKVGFGDECEGVIDVDETDRVHIVSGVFTGWVSKDELRKSAFGDVKHATAETGAPH